MKPDLDAVCEFLVAVRPRGPWKLVGLHADRDPSGKTGNRTTQVVPVDTFGPKGIDRLRRWVEYWNTTHGLYIEINPSRKHAWGRRSKAKLDPLEVGYDVWALQWCVVDLDPPDGATPDEWAKTVTGKLAGLKELKPTLVWRSGNGMQAGWRVSPPLIINNDDDVERGKLISQGVAEAIHAKLGLQSDKVASIEHIFRVAGTVNWPNAVKRAKGRVPILAGDMTLDPANVYAADALPMAKPKPKRAVYSLTEPPGGWDQPDNVACAVLHLKHTKDLAREGVAGTAMRTAQLKRKQTICVF